MNALKQARLDAGLSQIKASQLLGIPTRTLQHWEAGERTPPEWAERLVITAYNDIKKGESTMKTREIMETVYNALNDISVMTDEEITCASELLFAAEKIAEIESTTFGSEGDDVIAQLLEHGFVLDGKPQFAYAADILGHEINVTDRDLQNAAKLWLTQDLREMLAEEL